MENLHQRIEGFLSEIMEITYSGLEHFHLIWKGKLLINRKSAILYIKRNAETLELIPIFTEEKGEVKISFMHSKETARSKHWINIILLLVTFFTTLAAGAFQQGVNPFLPVSNLLKGLAFSLTLMSILGAHELGHYFAARRNGVKATFPYFIPAPHIIGTFGAVIKMKSPITDKNALVEIGVSGPLIGFFLATIALMIGFSLSTVVPSVGGGLILGDSILMKLFSYLYFPSIGEGEEVLLHPIAFAGWIGYFVTAMNLLPVGQLDGGHISYALFKKEYRFIAYISFGLVLLAGFFWFGWIFWGILLLLIGFHHPPPLDNISEVDLKNKILGYISLVVFILTFVPNPFQFQ